MAIFAKFVRTFSCIFKVLSVPFCWLRLKLSRSAHLFTIQAFLFVSGIALSAYFIGSLLVPTNVFSSACSDFDGNQATCQATTGCTWDSLSCSAYNNNQATCQATTGCTYPGNSGDCSSFNADEATCGSTSGCTQNYTNCSWNGSSCDGGGSCSGYGDEGSCNSATYFSSCSGNYDTGACTGTYNPGTCSGTYDNTPPTLSSAVVDGVTLTLTYNETLAGVTPANNNFAVIVDGTGINVLENQVSVSGTTVTLTLDTNVRNGTTVTISYTAGLTPIQDAAGNVAADLSGQGVTNNTADTFAPTLSTARITGTTLTLTYNETLNSSSIPATSAFSVTAAGVAQTVSSVNVTGATTVLTLSATPTNNTAILISYTAGASPIEDSAGNNAANLSGEVVIRRNTDAWTERTGAGNRNWEGITSSSDGTKIAAAALNGYIYTSTDSGATWSTQSNSSGSRLWNSITSSSDGTKLAAGLTNGYIYTSTDSGATWSTQGNSSGSKGWLSITSSSDGTKLAAGTYNSYIYTSSDSGATWTERTGSGVKYWYGITSSSDGTKIAAAPNETLLPATYIYTSTDSGATWSTQSNSSGDRSWYSVTSSSDGTKLAAVPSSGYIYTSSDSGATWTERTGAGSRTWQDIISSADGTKLVAMPDSGYIYTSSDSGATWTERTGAGSRQWWSVTSSSDGTMIFAGASGYIYTTTLDYTAPTMTLSTADSNVTGSFTVTAVSNEDTADFAVGDLTVTNGSISGFTTTDAQNYSFTVTPTADGAVTVQAGAATFTDAAGNSNTASNLLSVTYTTPVATSVTTPSGYRSSIFSSFFNPPSVQIGEPGCQPGNLFSTLTGGKCISPSTPTESSKSGLPPGFQFTQVLRIGDFSEEVRNLQKFLNAQGFTIATSGNGSKGNEIRSFGLATKAALIKFQIANNIKPSLGFFGPITRGVVNGMVGK